jgi:hypothetical protein
MNMPLPIVMISFGPRNGSIAGGAVVAIAEGGPWRLNARVRSRSVWSSSIWALICSSWTCVVVRSCCTPASALFTAERPAPVAAWVPCSTSWTRRESRSLSLILSSPAFARSSPSFAVASAVGELTITGFWNMRGSSRRGGRV